MSSLLFVCVVVYVFRFVPHDGKAVVCNEMMLFLVSFSQEQSSLHEANVKIVSVAWSTQAQQNTTSHTGAQRALPATPHGCPVYARTPTLLSNLKIPVVVRRTRRGKQKVNIHT